MNIDELIQREAPRSDEHDVSFARELRRAYIRVRHLNDESLLVYLQKERRVADCIVAHELAKERGLT